LSAQADRPLIHPVDSCCVLALGKIVLCRPREKLSDDGGKVLANALSLGATDICDATGIVPDIPATTLLMIPPNGVIGACFRGLRIQINQRLLKRNDDRATLSRAARQLNPGMVSSIEGAALGGSSAAGRPVIRPVRPRSGGRGIRGTGYDVGGHLLALLADVGRARA
jgi:hypothetical protein